MKKSIPFILGAAGLIGLSSVFSYAAKHVIEEKVPAEEFVKLRQPFYSCFNEENEFGQKVTATSHTDYSVGYEDEAKNVRPDSVSATLSVDGKVSVVSVSYSKIQESFNGQPHIWTAMRTEEKIAYTPEGGVDSVSNISEVQQPDGSWKRAEEISYEGKIEDVLKAKAANLPAFKEYTNGNKGLMEYAYVFYVRSAQRTLGCALPRPVFGSKKPG